MTYLHDPPDRRYFPVKRIQHRNEREANRALPGYLQALFGPRSTKAATPPSAQPALAPKD